VDYGTIHWDNKAGDRQHERRPQLAHVPADASGLDQVEICLSAVQRKILTPNDFADFREVEERLLPSL
jgi:hypothetical protein